jgi:hypothetical protein
MDKKLAGLLGAVAGLAVMNSAQAAISPAATPSEALHASSYADLLAPIPNAVALMQADDAARGQQSTAEALVGAEVAQGYYYGHPYYRPRYHHHHHHRYYRPRHHHHHHHGAFIGVPGVGGVVVGR